MISHNELKQEAKRESISLKTLASKSRRTPLSKQKVAHWVMDIISNACRWTGHHHAVPQGTCLLLLGIGQKIVNYMLLGRIIMNLLLREILLQEVT